MFKSIVVICVLSATCSFGQQADSLKRLEIVEDTASVQVLNNLYNQYIHSDPKLALDYTLQALDISLNLNYKKGIAFCYNNIGVFYKNQGAPDKAMSYYLESLELNREIGNTVGEAYTMNNIGSIYSLQGNYDNALIFFLKSYHLLDSIKDVKSMVGALNNLGNVYATKGEDYRAIGFYKNGLRFFEDHSKGDFDPYLNIGKVYFMRGEYKRAKTYYIKSLKMNEERNNLTGLAYAKHHLMAWYSVMDQTEEALKIELEALSIAEEIANNPLLVEIHLSLSELYFSLNQIKNAYNSRILYDAYKDALYNDESQRKLAELEVTYLLLEKEKEIELIKKENELNKLRVDNTKTVVLLGIMGTILLMATLFIVYVIRKNKRTVILHG